MSLTRNELIKHLIQDPDFQAGCAYRNGLVRRGKRGKEYNLARYAVFILMKAREYFDVNLFSMETRAQRNLLWYTQFTEVMELQYQCTGRM